MKREEREFYPAREVGETDLQKWTDEGRMLSSKTKIDWNEEYIDKNDNKNDAVPEELELTIRSDK